MTTSTSGKLYLVPTPLSEDNFQTIPAYVQTIVHTLDVFIVEKAKTARRHLKGMGFPTPFDDCLFFELNKRTDPKDIPSFLEPALKEGRSIGLMSEAGVPGVADPGARVVRMAHRKGIEVSPMVGPSSILLAIMGAGLNGQQFAFKGYLSPKRPALAKDLKKWESHSARTGETQVFIETPYRNIAFFETALQALSASSLLTVATDLTLPTQYIRTFSIMDWQRIKKPMLHKRPTVFLLQGRR